MFKFIWTLLRLQLLRTVLKRVALHPKFKQHTFLLGPLFILLEWFFTRRAFKKH
ncbi:MULTISPECIES: hypothetical protein [Legionella]|uniref:Uncharacterized protein n=1 Tax=Legionella drozanskii LLAP-1 TaxID=1212489 RepID=A0A0W0TE40_9GAMM|nr:MULTISPECIES: hypothetical protein [Legionella]KTC93855.1 hypothetical protein Ldro_0205 [Legionella drozanskii LLAP-1]